MNIIKKGYAAHTIPFHLSDDASLGMGYTRMTKQESALKNQKTNKILLSSICYGEISTRKNRSL